MNGPIRLFIVERTKDGLRLPDGTDIGFFEAPVGAMWHENEGDPRWTIRLPGGKTWADGHFWPYMWDTGLDDDGNGWEVSGEAPNLTVSPSIFCDPPDGWHGFIRNGEIVDA